MLNVQQESAAHRIVVAFSILCHIHHQAIRAVAHIHAVVEARFCVACAAKIPSVSEYHRAKPVTLYT